MELLLLMTKMSMMAMMMMMSRKIKPSSTFSTLNRQMLIWRNLRPREATVVPSAILMLEAVIMVMVVIIVMLSSQEYLRGRLGFLNSCFVNTE